MTMTKQIRLAITFSAILSLTVSCKSEQEKKEEVVNQKKEQLKSANEKEISDLNEKHKAISRWDSLETFTYVLQEKFIDENEPISFQGKLRDIYKSDSTYLLKVEKNNESRYKWNYIATISLSKEKFFKLKKILESSNHSKTGCFIFKVSKVTSPFVKIKSHTSLDEYSEISASNEYSDSELYLDFDFYDKLLIFQGDLIDFHLNEIVTKDNE
jgi:hypothetical protein